MNNDDESGSIVVGNANYWSDEIKKKLELIKGQNRIFSQKLVRRKRKSIKQEEKLDKNNIFN